MKTRLLFLLLSGLFLIPPALWADGEGTKRIIYDTSLGPVTFYHDKHVEHTNNDCIKCHHVKDGEEKQSCRPCHKKKSETAAGDPLSFYDVKMKFCRGCHREIRSDNPKSIAPTLCRECHDVKKINWGKAN